MTEHVKIQQNGAVLEIVFARPEKKNALSNTMYRAVSDALESVRTNNNVRVVLFGAEGDFSPPETTLPTLPWSPAEQAPNSKPMPSWIS